MSKFTTPLLFVFGITAIVGIGGWRGASGKLSAASDSLTTTSNKLAEATMKLAEQGATTETLRVQIGLQKNDLVTASNQIAAASAQLAQQMSRIRAMESEIGQRTAQVASLNRSNALLQSSIASFQTRTESLTEALDAARVQIAEAGKKIESASAALNETEASKSALLARLNDPSALRAQLDTVTASPNGKVKNLRDAKITIKPDGTVEIPTPPAKPASKNEATSSVFSEPPTASTNAPKILLNY